MRHVLDEIPGWDTFLKGEDPLKRQELNMERN